MKRLLVIAAAGIASGVLLACALPPIGWWWLGPLCLAPVLAAVRGAGLLRGFVGGILAPAATAGSVIALHPDGQNPHWLLVGCGFFGFLVAIICCVAAESKLGGWRWIGVLGALAVSLEFALFPILPAHLALTESRVQGMLMLASVGGIWLVSLLLWTTNAALAEALRTKHWRPAATLLGLFVLAALLGLFVPAQSGNTVRVAAVQTQSTEMESLEGLSHRAGTLGAKLAVWPESAGIAGAPSGDTQPLRDLSAKPGMPAIATSFNNDFSPVSHNAAAVFWAGTESERYYKRKLFGSEKTFHTPGESARSVQWSDVRLGLNICFDPCYPRMVAENGGDDLIVIPTADPESPGAFIAATHAAFTPFRAAETGTPIVRGDMGAYSMIVDGSGRVVADLGPSEGVLVGDVAVGHHFTLYSVFGDWVLWACLGWVAVSLALGLIGLMRPIGAQSRTDIPVTLPSSSKS